MHTRRSDWLVPAGLIALSLVPAIAGTARLAQLGGGTVTSDNARFHAAPAPIVLHVVAAVIYSILGALQFSPGFRRSHRRLHRHAGRLLIVLALVAASSGLWMTLTYPWPAGDGVVVYIERLVFGGAMVLSLLLGIDAIRRRRFAEHGEWMIRAYAIGLAAGTQVLTHLPWFVLMDVAPGATARGVMMGLGWVVNVGVGEWVVGRGREEEARDRKGWQVRGWSPLTARR